MDSEIGLFQLLKILAEQIPKILANTQKKGWVWATLLH